MDMFVSLTRWPEKLLKLVIFMSSKSQQSFAVLKGERISDCLIALEGTTEVERRNEIRVYSPI